MGFVIRRMRIAGSTRHQATPENNQFSHPHDALQYGALAGEQRSTGKTDPAPSRRKQNGSSQSGGEEAAESTAKYGT